jgi:predicted PurR-regulated permease PerM
LARDFKLEERTRRFVKEVPVRLRGGTAAEALRAAGSRGVAFLATTVLTIFFLLHGPRIARSAVGQITDPARRARFRAVAIAVYRRGFGYATGTLAMAFAAGLFGYDMARLADVPGAAPLGIWIGLWDLVPSVGAFVGALPILALAGVVSGAKAAWLAAGFLVYQAVENRFVQRRVEKATVRIGPFLTLVGGLVGLELSGVAGALLTVLAIALAVVAAEEVCGKQAPA